jgi:D-arabinose 1-dehydrogenase-like Zn-dependent alcohol dehydrogenase
MFCRDCRRPANRGHEAFAHHLTGPPACRIRALWTGKVPPPPGLSAHGRANGDWPVKAKLPLIPGHEGVGLITAIGSGVTALSVGDRVAIPWLGHACGRCEYCATGWETLCLQQQDTGYSIDGSYAELVKADANFVARVPDGIDPFEAAPLTCAGVTTY